MWKIVTNHRNETKKPVENVPRKGQFGMQQIEKKSSAAAVDGTSLNPNEELTKAAIFLPLRRSTSREIWISTGVRLFPNDPSAVDLRGGRIVVIGRIYIRIIRVDPRFCRRRGGKKDVSGF